MTGLERRPSVVVVVPCLDEARHIRGLLERLAPSAAALGAEIVVVDGGSTDGTVAIVEEYRREHGGVRLLHNPKRIQSAAVNAAVFSLQAPVDYFIRIDAHGGYPEDYCERLVDEAIATGADSVVVSMRTEGHGLVQRAAAMAQNSRLGTGGARHRHRDEGAWIDHGHHALMRVSAFAAVGGYDETFRQNEDAELDYRLRRAGFRIWLTGRTHMVYFPRSTFARLFLQYLGYGRGRARNVLKHRAVPKLRQMVPLLVFPSAVLALLAFLHPLAALPLAVWIAVCAGFGARAAIGARDAGMLAAGVSVMVMHFAWSFGFWQQLATTLPAATGPER